MWSVHIVASCDDDGHSEGPAMEIVDLICKFD